MKDDGDCMEKQCLGVIHANRLLGHLTSREDDWHQSPCLPAFHTCNMTCLQQRKDGGEEDRPTGNGRTDAIVYAVMRTCARQMKTRPDKSSRVSNKVPLDLKMFKIGLVRK